MSDASQAEAAWDFDASRYPTAFFEDYEALCCFSSNENAETLLVLERKSGRQLLAKCYLAQNRTYGETESTLLKRLDHAGIPKFVAEYQNEQMLCVVRDYIIGLPLNEYVAETRPTPEQSVSIALQICDILSYLHGLEPPIIHRDIKPQNIIVDGEAKAWLIDYGISREYDASASKDTQYFGTVDFAPPEQYGFSQTDRRSDIFSLGVLIGWLLTGESQPRNAMPKLASPRMQKIVKTCTDLTPERRYASAELVKKALQHADGHVQRRVLRGVCCLAASLVCLCAGFFIGRYTDFNVNLFAPADVTFQEPLIEQAVREALGLSAEEQITQNDLLSVTEIFIFGDAVAANAGAFSEAQNRMGAHDETVKNGGIRTLEDLQQLKHLKIIHIALQDITDISPLAELDSLEIVDLNHNPIEDITPLGELFSLRELCVFDSRVSDFSALQNCLLLETIDAGKSRVSALSAFDGIGSLSCLKLRSSTLTSLSGIESLTGLEQLTLGDVRDRDLTPLLRMPFLDVLELSEDLHAQADQDLAGSTLQISYY